MIHRMLTHVAPTALGLLTVLGTAEASAATEDRVHVFGPIPYGASGDYVDTGDTYGGAPVYVLETNATWRLYRRLNGTWYIDFDALDEQWSGTVAIGPDADTPFGGEWDAAGQGCTPTDVVTVSNSAYPGMTTGTYAFTGELYNDQPVYALESGGYTFSVYQRDNGQWYLDFDDVDEQWAGTLAYTTAAAAFPWDAPWNGNMVMSPVASVEVTGAPYSGMTTGSYVYGSTIYDGKPVFQRTSGGYTFSVYQRHNGQWYLDFNGIDEQWSGTLAYTTAAVEWPWEGTWNGAMTLGAIED